MSKSLPVNTSYKDEESQEDIIIHGVIIGYARKLR